MGMPISPQKSSGPDRIWQGLQAPLLGKARIPSDITECICARFLDLDSTLTLGRVDRSWVHWVYFTQTMFHSETHPMTPQKLRFLLNLIKKIFTSETLPSISHFSFKANSALHYNSQLSAISQHVPRLRTLKVHKNCSGVIAVDLSRLGAFAGLQSLYFGRCDGVTDLAPLSVLTSLQSLSLKECNGLTDLAPLRSLASLQRLNLIRCSGITNPAPLRSLTSLQRLNLVECNSMTNLAPLSSLTGLQRLYFGGCNGITNLAPLSGLTSLQSLYFGWRRGIINLASLRGLTSLQCLCLGWCDGITDLAPLSSLASLQRLYLGGCNGITNLAPLSSLTSLQWLYLGRCDGITNLAPLSSLTGLQRLDPRGLRVTGSAANKKLDRETDSSKLQPVPKDRKCVVS